MSAVAGYEIAISIVIFIASTIGGFSAKIYRIEVLLYGTSLRMCTQRHERNTKKLAELMKTI